MSLCERCTECLQEIAFGKQRLIYETINRILKVKFEMKPIAKFALLMAGLVFGVLVTFLLEGIFSRTTSSPANASLSQVSSAVGGSGTREDAIKQQLEKEKQELIAKLKDIDQKLSSTSSESSTMKATPRSIPLIEQKNKKNPKETATKQAVPAAPSSSSSSIGKAKSNESKTKEIKAPSSTDGRNKGTIPVSMTPVSVPTSSTSSSTRGSTSSSSSSSSNNNDCQYDFKVYVYDIPQQLGSVKISEESRENRTQHVCHKCILEQFSLEYIMLDFFTQYCGRTQNPDEADFFYLPIVRDAEFRWNQHQSTRNRAPSDTEDALLLMIEKNDPSKWKSVFKVTDQYWNKYKGADHIIAMPAPVTNLRHETSQRGYFHYMIQLHRPIFLALEYSSQFVLEYPICAAQKNIVVPYPTTDVELFNGKLLNMSNTVRRDSLLYYAGGLHGDCVEVRKAMKHIMRNASSLPGVIPNVRSSQETRERGFMQSTFCPIPIGDSPSSKRMYDVLNFGCIPVILSDDLVWAYTKKTGGPLDQNEFSLQFPQSIVYFTAEKTLRVYASKKKDLGVLPRSQQLIYDLLERSVKSGGQYKNSVYVNPLVQVLQNIPAEDVAHLRKGVSKVAGLFRYYHIDYSMKDIPTAVHHFPSGGAIQMLAQQLSLRKQHGISALSESCQGERARKHAYIGKFTCDPDKVESLVADKKRRLFEENRQQQQNGKTTTADSLSIYSKSGSIGW